MKLSVPLTRSYAVGDRKIKTQSLYFFTHFKGRISLSYRGTCQKRRREKMKRG